MIPVWQRDEKDPKYTHHYESTLRPFCGGEEEIFAQYGVEAVTYGGTDWRFVACDGPVPAELKHWGLVRYRPAGNAEARLA